MSMSMKCKKLDLSLILTSDMDTWASKKDYFVESFDEMVSHLKSEMDELKSTEDFLNIFDGKGKDIVEDCSRPADSQQIIMYLYLCHLKKKFNLGRQYIQYRNRTSKSKFQQRIQAFTFIQTSSSHRKTCGELLLGGKQLRLQVGQD